MQLWPSTADQYIIAYKSYRQTLLLSPLKSLQVEALWVITHLQQQLAQLKLSEDTVVAELEPQVTRVANGAGVPRCQGWKDMPFVGSSFRYIFCSMRLRYDTPPKKSPYIPQWYRKWLLPYNILYTPSPNFLFNTSSLVGWKKHLPKTQPRKRSCPSTSEWVGKPPYNNLATRGGWEKRWGKSDGDGFSIKGRKFNRV